MHTPEDKDRTLIIESGETVPHGADGGFTIQQMAEATGLSTHTLRYYERAGLMQPVRRSETNGYRAYSRQHLDWVEFIMRLRATGMPIRDIRHYTELILQGEPTVPDRMRLLKEHRTQIEAHLLEVEQHLVAITAKIAYYEQEADQHQSMTSEEIPTSQNEE